MGNIFTGPQAPAGKPIAVKPRLTNHSSHDCEPSHLQRRIAVTAKRGNCRWQNSVQNILVGLLVFAKRHLVLKRRESSSVLDEDGIDLSS